MDWTVYGYHLTTRVIRVSAETADEAITLAKEGRGEVIDSEPGPDVYRPKWRAEPASPETQKPGAV